MRTIIYCYGDGHPLILGGENLTDADRKAIRSHQMIRPVECGAERQSWQEPDSDKCPNHANPPLWFV